MVSSVTGFTPVDATKPDNVKEVRMNMLTHAKHRRAYEEIKLGNKVRLYRRRKHLNEKENVPIWSSVAYEVVKIGNTDAGKLYYLSNQPDKPVLRSQVMKA